MKKILLTAAAFAALTVSVSAQRMTLHEEFTGENCGPCAATNPGFWALCDESINTGKLIHISYMEPIPSSGWFYMETQALSDARATYYSVPFAPYGRYDGHVPDPTCSNPGHPACFTQADIDAEAAIPDSFSMSVTNAWNATYDSVTAVITVTCNTAWTGTTPYLRVALVETVNFATPPGTNGESHFENVVRAMYPAELGTSVSATWGATATQTYTITGAVPSFVDKSGAPYIVAWIQDDANKVIAQAAQASPLPGIPLDIAANTTSGVPSLACASGSYSVTHTATIKNAGTTTLTTAQIWYKADAGAYTVYNWSGSLASGATTPVTMPSLTIAAVPQGSNHTITDSVAMPNGVTDINPANNLSATTFFIESTVGMPMTYSTSFENYYDGDSLYYFTNNASNGDTWNIWQTGTTGVYLGHSGTYAAGFPFISYPAGTVNSLVLPEVNVTDPAGSSISFWVSYSQQTTASSDLLEVVYSTDCGSTWTSLWSMSGSGMVTLPASTTAYSYPTSPSQYRQYSANLGGVTAGPAMLAFRATDGNGNFIFVDDINVHLHSTTSVQNVAAATTNVSVYPNPAKDEATLSFTLSAASDVQIQVVDGLGRIMNVVANDKMDAGAHTFTINTESLASGVYNILIHTEGGVYTQRLSVVK